MVTAFALNLLIDQVPHCRIIWPRYSRLRRATTCLIKCETPLLNLPVKMDGRMRTVDRASCWSLRPSLPGVYSTLPSLFRSFIAWVQLLADGLATQHRLLCGERRREKDWGRRKKLQTPGREIRLTWIKNRPAGRQGSFRYHKTKCRKVAL